MDNRQLLLELFTAALKSANPREAMRRRFPQRPKGKTVVVGAGKAAARMAQAFEQLCDWPHEGVVVDRHGAVAETANIRVLHAAHPVPDAAGVAASAALLEAVSDLTQDDLVVALISGGGSALLPCPAEGLSLDDEIALTQALLASGAPIAEMNCVRKQVSRIKGGRLAAAAAPAKVVTFIVSDVVGDDPAVVASGPTVPGPGNVKAALEVIARYRIPVSAAVRRHLEARRDPAPDPDNAMFSGNEVHILASARVALKGAADRARELGVTPLILSEAIEGEARDIGKMHAAIARQFALGTGPLPLPLVLLSGGETTVTLHRGPRGKGGRNTEFLLSLACDIAGEARISALAADTDGIDGSEDNAGAYADGGSVERMVAAGINPKGTLAAHDAWSAFAAVDDLLVTGPTGTNVNDFRAILLKD